MLRRCSEAVTQQEAYLEWAMSSNLASQDILEVMNDGTQALCWLQINRLDDWIEIFNKLINNTEPNQENKLARFDYLRTAARIFSTATRYELAENAIAKLKNLVLSDVNWEQKTWVEIEIVAVELNLLEAKHDIDKALVVATKVKEQIETIERLQLANPQKISTLWHNNAAPLFRIGLYSEAELMFRRAIALNPQNWCALAFLAACLTKMDKDPEESDILLAKAASISNQRDYEALLARIY
jgi:tetratricopeptide (TPR) repeat protein